MPSVYHTKGAPVEPGAWATIVGDCAAESGGIILHDCDFFPDGRPFVIVERLGSPGELGVLFENDAALDEFRSRIATEFDDPFLSLLIERPRSRNADGNA